MAEIFATEYNNLRSRLSAVMVTAYGQTIYATSDVTGDYVTNTTSTDKVTAAQWNNLYIDMIRARTHQLGSFTQDTLRIGNYTANTTNTDKVTQTFITYLSNLMTTIETNSKVLDITNQASIATINTSSKSTGWNAPITHEVTINFTTNNNFNYFFNSGSRIRLNANIVYTGADSKTLDWQSLLSTMGNIDMDYTQTSSSSGLGTGSTIGAFDLTTAYQVVYQRYAATYALNNYRVSVKKNAATPTAITVLVEFNDDATGNIDEQVLGTLNSNVQVVRADGTVLIDSTNYTTVSVTAPTATLVSAL